MTDHKCQRLFRSLLVLFVCLIVPNVVPATLYGQCPNSCPPTPDCHSDSWIGPEQTTFVICSNGRPCTFTVQYCHRRACGVFNDIAITCIVASDPSCAQDYTMKQLGELAVNAAVNHRFQQSDPNYQNIPPCPQYNVTWRVYAASCWLFRDGVYLPCAGSGQCFATYRVCWDLMQQGCNDLMLPRVRTTRGSTIASGNCPQWTPEADPCLEWCE